MSALPNPLEPQPSTPAKPQIQPSAPVPREPERRRGGPWTGLIALAVLGVLGYLGYQWFAKPVTDTTVFAAVKTVTATQGSVERIIRVAGSTSAREFATITAPLLQGPEARNSLILNKVVKPGSIVQKGEIIAQIDGQWLIDHIDDVKDFVRQAENDVEKRKAEQSVEFEQLQQTLRVAKSTWDKAKLEFGAAEVRSDVERELLKLTMEEAEARYKQQLADVNQKKAAHASELKILDITCMRHRRHLGRHENDLKRYTIKAPIEGLAVMQNIYRGGEMVQISEGDQVAPGQPFMKIVNPRTMQVEGTVNQSESSDVRLGQEVRVGIDSFPALKLRGKVSGVNALAVAGGRSQNYIRNIPVRIQILDTDPRVIPDLSAHGDVILERADGVLHLPAAAIQEEAGGKPFLFVQTPQQTFEKRPVALGLRSHLDVAVTEGLKAGDVVRLN